MTRLTHPPLDRVAGAPISWGVCEVPGWGYQLTPEQVLGEMRDLGLAATEFGPDGFLPTDAVARASMLAAYGLRPVGGFVPVVLHDPAHDLVPEIDKALAGFAASGAQVMVLAADTGRHGYDGRAEPDAAGWRALVANLDRIAAVAAGHGVTATLHPHVGTVVEGPDEVQRVLDGSAIPLCLDTGHLLIGGCDPLALARQAPDRVAHVHAKDVDAATADRVRSGELTYSAAVAAGMYRPLGAGDVDIAGIVAALATHGYQGWYVLEQDRVLAGEPANGGPANDVRASLAYLSAVRA
jgi:inosose dehydratase